jgi:hypothetical protein
MLNTIARFRFRFIFSPNQQTRTDHSDAVPASLGASRGSTGQEAESPNYTPGTLKQDEQNGPFCRSNMKKTFHRPGPLMGFPPDARFKID